MVKKRKMKICSSVCNPVIYDYRVLKTAEALSKKYSVIVLGTRDKDTKNKEKKDGFVIVRTNKPLITKLGLIFSGINKYFFSKDSGNENNISASKKDNNFIFKIMKKPLSFGSLICSFISDFLLLLLYANKSWVIYKKLRKINADIYLANDIDTLIPSCVVASRNDGKVVYDAHELCVEEGYIKTKFFKNILYKIEHKYIKKVSHVISVNELSCIELQKMHKLSKRPSSIYNFPKFLKPNKKSLFEAKSNGQKIKIPKDKIHLIYQGVYSFGRGLEENILAMKYVDNAILYLRGYGPWEEKLKEIVNNNNLTNKVIFLDPVKPYDVVDALLFADIGIFTPLANASKSIYISSPNKLYQYIMAGLCVVTSNLPEYQKVIKESNCGIIMNKVTPKSIADNINSLLKNKSLINKYRKNSLKNSKNYSWESQEASLYKIYHDLE